MPEVAKIKGLDIRDKKIADSTAVTSVAQTDSIRMTTTNGEEVFIARDSFVDAIASVFKSNAKSSITSLFGELTESNVSSVGSINMSNLASVLSALMVGTFTTLPIIRYNANLEDNHTTPYIMYSYGNNDGNLKISIPYTWSDNRCMQININKYRLSFRQYVTSWGSWTGVDLTAST
jgi:chemotaxis protein CheY-P-specific phosphatase CheC